MAQIKILLNGEERVLANKISVSQLILELDLDIKKIAIEKDFEILMPEQFSEVLLDEGSRIEIVHFIGGG
jgi:thiamine biosynthesis protein ThiS